MDYKVVLSSEYLYPDIFDYKTASDSINVLTARNSYAVAQVIIKGVENGAAISVVPNGFDTEVWEMVAIPVEKNVGLEPEEKIDEADGMLAQNVGQTKPVNEEYPHCPERRAPFFVYDCMKPLGKTVTAKDGVCALYISKKIEKDAKVEDIKGSLDVKIGNDSVSIPVNISVSKTVVPDESLYFYSTYDYTIAAECHNMKVDSPEFAEVDKKYLDIMRRGHINTVAVPRPIITKKSDGKYDFDFSNMINFINKYKKVGYTYFFLAGIGHRKSWQESTILVTTTGKKEDDIDALSLEAYDFLSQYLPRLRECLVENGLLDLVTIDISDEPNHENMVSYRALSAIVRKFLPDVKINEPVSFAEVHGAVDIYIALNSAYQSKRDMYETYRAAGDEVWHYVCLGPRGGNWTNRFMDYPILSTRYLLWGNYKYDLKGFLHWASNCFKPHHEEPAFNPYELTCPMHKNADSVVQLPAGDTHSIYPGDNAPNLGMRHEALRESAEEFEMMKLLSKYDKPLADEICDSCFQSFNEIEFDPVKFEEARTKLINALSKY